MATGTNGIPTATELEATGGFSFQTSITTATNYVSSKSQCPRYYIVKNSTVTGYNVTISGTYDNYQLVPMNQISVSVKRGKITLTVSGGSVTSNNLTYCYGSKISSMSSMPSDLIELNGYCTVNAPSTIIWDIPVTVLYDFVYGKYLQYVYFDTTSASYKNAYYSMSSSTLSTLEGGGTTTGTAYISSVSM